MPYTAGLRLLELQAGGEGELPKGALHADKGGRKLLELEFRGHLPFPPLALSRVRNSAGATSSRTYLHLHLHLQFAPLDDLVIRAL